MTKLTKRQEQVLDGIMHGATNSEIAKALGLKEPTVKMHLKALFRAKGVTSRLELVVQEYKNQIREGVCIMKRVLRDVEYSNRISGKYIKYDIENYFKKWGKHDNT